MNKDALVSEHPGTTLLVTMATMPIGILSHLYVTRYLWGVAVEPTFHIPTPSNAVLYALYSLASLWTYILPRPNGHETTMAEHGGRVAALLASPWITMGLVKIGFWLGS